MAFNTRSPRCRRSLTHSAVLAGVFMLAGALIACGDKAGPKASPASGAVSTTSPGDAQAIARSVPGAGGDPSVPAASAALSGQETQLRAGQDKPENSPQAGMSKADESGAMPMPGQTDNHSTPAAAKRASN